MPLKDKRLLLCAEMTEGRVVCDIGTDHGYLPAHLIKTGKCSRVIAADLNELPLESARQTFEREGITEYGEFYLSDGLRDVPLDGVTDVVIAGMGGELIGEILSIPKAKQPEINYILQPMTKPDALRRFLGDNGFEVREEKAVWDGRFVYSAMKCIYTGVPYRIDILRENIGLLDGSGDSAVYLDLLVRRLKRAADGMSRTAPIKAAELYSLIEMIGRVRNGDM
ncbi:MAG: class I SAM-dependent methyltransferase [Huintestinicola sp.]